MAYKDIKDKNKKTTFSKENNDSMKEKRKKESDRRRSKRKRDNYYDDDNYTGHYHVTVNGETIEAFCAQPSLNSPIGTTTATKMNDNTNSDKLIKFVIYLYQNNN